MNDNLRAAFRGCPHHSDDFEACIQYSDDFEACIQYSGTAPCGVEEERDALAAHVERLSELLSEHHNDFMGDGSEAWDEEDWDGRVAFALEDTPETSLAQRDARMKEAAARALADKLALNASNARENRYWLSGDVMENAANEALEMAEEMRRQATGGDA